jgi:hypothetical protein
VGQGRGLVGPPVVEKVTLEQRVLDRSLFPGYRAAPIEDGMSAVREEKGRPADDVGHR